MSKGNTTEADFIAFVFLATSMPSYGANVYLALYTSDPTEGGAPNNNECAYGAYARVLVSRDAAGWDVSGNQADNFALLQFPEATGGTETATHVGIVTSASGGSGQILYSGALDDNLNISTLIQPQFAAGALIIQED